MMKPSHGIVLIAHNLRSCHNIGSLLRTAEGLGVEKVYLCGYTPYPLNAQDNRLPHIAQKLNKQIHKTALGAEDLIAWEHKADVYEVIEQLRGAGYTIMAIEQTAESLDLSTFKPPKKLALLVGREVEGIEPEVLEACDGALEITMYGQKESFNVVQAAAMALFHCTFS